MSGGGDGLGLDEEERHIAYPPPGWYRKYGVTFIDLQPEDLELVRQWRNHPDIRRFMVFQDEITSQMQQAWFAGLDPAKMVFSVLSYRGEKVGLTHLKNIDVQEGSAEGGIAIWHPRHQNGLLSYRVSLAGMDYNFLVRGLSRIDVTVLASNTRARRFVRSLGYQLSAVPSENGILRGSVDPATYFRTVRSWREIIRSEMRAEGEPFPVGS